MAEKAKLTELRKVTCGMRWEPDKFGRETWDLDQSIAVINEAGEFVKQISFKYAERSNEFYYHESDLFGGSGKSVNDDEKIDINFHELRPDYDRLIVVMNIYHALKKGQDLSMVKNAYIHLRDEEAGKDLVEYRIEDSDKFRNKTGMFVGEFYKKDGKWEFKAIGEPVRIRDMEDMFEIIKIKYANVSTREKGWEEFLETSQLNSVVEATSQDQPNLRRRGFLGRLLRK